MFWNRHKKEAIALVASISAGKTTVVKILQGKSFRAIKLHEEIRRVAQDMGLDGDDRDVLHDVGNKLRKERGHDYLARVAVENMAKYTDYVIYDGIRHTDELTYLKKHYGDKILIMGITAPIEDRYKRAKERHQYKGLEDITLEDFMKMDDSENFSDEPHEMSVSACLDMADVTISNEGSLEEFEAKVLKVVRSEFRF